MAELSSRDGVAANSSRAAEPGGGECSVPGRGDQLAQVEIFGYLPQKFNLKYEMNIVTVASGVTAAGGQTGVLSLNLAIIPSLSWCLDPATSRHTRPARDA